MSQKRVTVDIDGTEISAIEAHYVISRATNQKGQRVGDSMQAKAYFYADMGDVAANPQDKVISFWGLATETADPLHNVTITYYKNDTDVLNTVKFRGWISVFETFNPAVENSASGAQSIGGAGNPSMASLTQYRQVLYCEMPVVLDNENFPKHKFTK